MVWHRSYLYLASLRVRRAHVIRVRCPCGRAQRHSGRLWRRQPRRQQVRLRTPAPLALAPRCRCVLHPTRASPSPRPRVAARSAQESSIPRRNRLLSALAARAARAGAGEAPRAGHLLRSLAVAPRRVDVPDRKRLTRCHVTQRAHRQQRTAIRRPQICATGRRALKSVKETSRKDKAIIMDDQGHTYVRGRRWARSCG
jgi:hypothetical protein